MAWLRSHQELPDNASFAKKQVTDPFLKEAMSVLPGLAPEDKFLLNDGKTPLSLKDAAAGIKAIYEDLLNRAWNEARARGDKLPDENQKLESLPPFPASNEAPPRERRGRRCPLPWNTGGRVATKHRRTRSRAG